MKKNILHEVALPYSSPITILKKLNPSDPYCLFESSEIDQHSERLSLLGINPSLEFIGKSYSCTIKLLDIRAKEMFEAFKQQFALLITKDGDNQLTLEFVKEDFSKSEDQRFEISCAAQVIRYFLKAFKSKEQSYTGLYGALGYNFVYPFEELETSKSTETPDFHLFYFDTLFVFNHLMEQLQLICLRETKPRAELISEELIALLKNAPSKQSESLKIGLASLRPTEEDFKKQILKAKGLFAKGEVMELVLSRKMTADIQGDVLELYESYKKINPSPYLFFLEFGDSQLFGASPEIMVRAEKGRVYLKPISGTAPRGNNAVEDHERLMELLNSEKEKSELDMLIDLGRNDLSRICKPGVKIDNYRSIEKYSHVFHTVAMVSGDLEEGKSGIDALIACLNAGTLTGTPKNAAMKYIEEIETHSRGYYGGCVGYFLMNGDVNTAITIRSAYIKENQLSYLSGATLLYECDPDFEITETKIKAAAFQQALKAFQV